MKSILFDTNVVLDVLLDREPHVFASGAAWAFVEDGKAEGMISAHAVSTVHYLLRKELGNPKARRVISEILRVFAIAAVNRSVLDEALESPSPDFEDAITAAAARVAGCDCVITRDPKGFRGSRVRCLTPEAAMPLLRK